MRNRSKYVILEFGRLQQPFIFSELSSHADVARALGGSVIAGGFCYIDQAGKYACYGESVSLKTQSRGEVDAGILNRLLDVTDNDPF